MSNGKGNDEDDGNPGWTWKWKLAAGAAAGIGIGASAWGVYKLLGSVSEEAEQQEDNRKMMKAPGKNGELMYRDDFERDPSAHFSQIRNDKRSGKSKLFGSDSEEAEQQQDNRKMMKAPGKNGELIYRDVFAQNPPGYFHQLHNDEKRKK